MFMFTYKLNTKPLIKIIARNTKNKTINEAIFDRDSIDLLPFNLQQYLRLAF